MHAETLAGASFAENFYGLKRRRKPLFETSRARAAVGVSAGEGRLRDQDIRRSLFFLVSAIHFKRCVCMKAEASL